MLSGDEQRLIRAWGGWPAVELLATAKQPSMRSGCSAGDRCPGVQWVDCTAKGLIGSSYTCPCPVGSDHVACHPVSVVSVKVTWARATSYARSLPDGLRADLNRARARSQRLAMQGHRRFTLGPGYEYMRRGADRDRPDLTHEQYDALRDAAWPLEVRASRLIRAEEDRLLDLALPLAAPEPADLLELLEAAC